MFSILLPSGYVRVMQLVCSILLPSGYVGAAYVLKIRNILYYFSGLNFLLMTPIEQPDTNHSTKNDVDFRETLPLIWALSAFSVNTRLRPSPPPRPPPANPTPL